MNILITSKSSTTIYLFLVKFQLIKLYSLEKDYFYYIFKLEKNVLFSLDFFY